MKQPKKKEENAVYNIGTVARICAMPVYTIRWLEQNELVCPQRTSGNQRLYTDSDLQLLRVIALLLKDNVNLQGIRLILKIKTKYSLSIEDDLDL